jgi:hypothetical protein
MIELGPDDGESVNGASARRQNEFRQDNSGRFDPIAPFSTHGPSVSGRSPMTTDAITQLAILADALTEIVDLTTADPKALAPPGEVLARAGDIAAEALAAAATYGRLPPLAEAGETREEALNSAGPVAP